MKVKLNRIGIVHSPYKNRDDVPIQASESRETGEIEIFEEYARGLKDLEGFSHIQVLYIFHKSSRYNLLVKPFLDDKLRGVFATRAPNRPNPVGISTLELIEIRKNKLKVKGIDMIDETPVIDIKPYVPGFDRRENIRIGWLEGKIDNESK